MDCGHANPCVRGIYCGQTIRCRIHDWHVYCPDWWQTFWPPKSWHLLDYSFLQLLSCMRLHCCSLICFQLSEFYGKEQARKAVWEGFLANIMLIISVYVAIIWEGAPFWGNQEAFETILSNTPHIVFASMTAYLVSQHHDVISYHWWMNRFPQRLWLRNNASTIVSQALDTVIFISLAFYGVFPVTAMIIGQYVKLLIALMDTPFIYTVKKLGIAPAKKG